MDWLFNTEIWVSLLTLTVLEIVLGIDNVIMISILSCKLSALEQKKARLTGLSLALITRVLFLMSLVWLASLTAPLFTVFGNDISVRDIIMIGGGLFLLVKGTHEIHGLFEPHESEEGRQGAKATFKTVVAQILVFDIVFSLDSVITAIGMAQSIGVMITAVVIALFIMLLASEVISNFIHKHPSLKLLALSFLLMVGVTLMAEGFEFHIPKGYIYFAMAFSGAVETLNILSSSRKKARAEEAV